MNNSKGTSSLEDCDFQSHCRLRTPELRKYIRETAFSLKGTNDAAAAKSLLSCLTLCDSIEGSPPGSPVPGILQKADNFVWSMDTRSPCFLLQISGLAMLITLS